MKNHGFYPYKYPISEAWKRRVKTNTRNRERTNSMNSMQTSVMTAVNNNSVTVVPKKIKKMTHSAVTQIALNLYQKKEELQKRFDTEGLTATDFALELNVPVGSLRSILNDIGIKHSNRKPYKARGSGGDLEARLGNLERAVKQIFEELGITPTE